MFLVYISFPSESEKIQLTQEHVFVGYCGSRAEWSPSGQSRWFDPSAQQLTAVLKYSRQNLKMCMSWDTSLNYVSFFQIFTLFL